MIVLVKTTCGKFAEVFDRPTVCKSALKFRYPYQEEIKEKVEQFDSFILTSPRAVKAIEKSGKRFEGETAYVVGPKTAEAARSIGLDPIGQDSGNSKELAKIVEGSPLFLCSNRRQDTIPNRTNCKEQFAYETVVKESVETPDDASSVVFFSPSATEAVDTTGDFKTAAIGPTTASHRENPDAVAERPEPKSLKEAILSA